MPAACPDWADLSTYVRKEEASYRYFHSLAETFLRTTLLFVRYNVYLFTHMSVLLRTPACAATLLADSRLDVVLDTQAFPTLY